MSDNTIGFIYGDQDINRDKFEIFDRFVDDSKEKIEKMAAEQDPVVKAALKTFSGSRIERVIRRIENELSDSSYDDSLLEIEDDDLSNEGNEK